MRYQDAYYAANSCSNYGNTVFNGKMTYYHSHVIICFRVCCAERQNFNAKDVFDRAKAGDEIAKRIIDEVSLLPEDCNANIHAISFIQVSDYLAVFTINISRMLDPEVIVFAGGMANAGEFLLSNIQHHFSRRTWTVLPSKVSLRIAKRCDTAGMIGAAVAASKLLD